MKSGNNNSVRLQRIVRTGLLIALAVVLRNLSYMVYFGGATGMRISFSGIFTKTAAILFGPLFGGMASGILDVAGYLLKPEGAYIPLLTVTAVLGGVLTGLLWRALRGCDTKIIKYTLSGVFIFAGLVGVINIISINYLSNSAWSSILNSIGRSRDITTAGLLVLSAVGILLLVIDSAVKNKNAAVYADFLKILVTTGIAGIIVSTLNTYILRLFIPELSNLAFFAFLVPRLINELFMTTIQAYIISLLLSLKIVSKNN